MNRRSKLARRTPLVGGKPLQRRTPLRCNGMFPSGSRLRGAALNPVSAKRRSDNAARVSIVSGMRLAVQGRCARCYLTRVLAGDE